MVLHWDRLLVLGQEAQRHDENVFCSRTLGDEGTESVLEKGIIQSVRFQGNEIMVKELRRCPGFVAMYLILEHSRFTNEDFVLHDCEELLNSRV
jgi:hypothetical protein